MTCPMLFSFAVVLCHSNFVALLDGCISLLRDNDCSMAWIFSLGCSPETNNLLWHWFISCSLAFLQSTWWLNTLYLPSESLWVVFPIFFSFFSFVSLNIYITCSFQSMSIFSVGIADFTSTYSLTHLPLFYIYILTFYNSHLYFSIHLYSSAH